MTKGRLASLALVLLPVVAAAQVPASPGSTRPARKLKVAVADLQLVGAEAGQETILSEVALTEAASFPGLEVVGRSDVQAMLSFERQRQLLGCTEDAACLAEIGGALGVDYLLLGTVGRIGKLHRLDLKLVDARKARVVGRVGESIEGGIEPVVSAVQRAVRRLLGPITGGLPAPPGAEAAAPARARWPAWVALGSGAVLLAAGATSGVVARNEYQQLKASQLDVGFALTYPSKSDRIKRLSLTADVLVGAGVVATGVGTWLWWRSRPTATVTVLPVAGPELAGLAVAGSF